MDVDPQTVLIILGAVALLIIGAGFFFYFFIRDGHSFWKMRKQNECGKVRLREDLIPSKPILKHPKRDENRPESDIKTWEIK